ncbi:MAG: hypothetical protein J0H57_25615 [Rhodospirillales bacterium]|nr:hypothetical protein [Rhodospirillales bacterium]
MSSPSLQTFTAGTQATRDFTSALWDAEYQPERPSSDPELLLLRRRLINHVLGALLPYGTPTEIDIRNIIAATPVPLKSGGRALVIELRRPAKATRACRAVLPWHDALRVLCHLSRPRIGRGWPEVTQELEHPPAGLSGTALLKWQRMSAPVLTFKGPQQPALFRKPRDLDGALERFSSSCAAAVR